MVVEFALGTHCLNNHLIVFCYFSRLTVLVTRYPMFNRGVVNGLMYA